MPDPAVPDRTLPVTAGKPFDVELGFGPSTGYSWHLDEPPTGVRLVGSDVVQPHAARTGDGATHVFHLKADDPGRYQLRFVLKRRWEAHGIETRVVAVEAR